MEMRTTGDCAKATAVEKTSRRMQILDLSMGDSLPILPEIDRYAKTNSKQWGGLMSRPWEEEP
jgi:hypothetical protein